MKHKYEVKKVSGLAALVASGTLSAVHAISHLTPALAALDYVAGHHEHNMLTEALSHPGFGLAYAAFVPLSIYHTLKESKQSAIYKSRIKELEVTLGRKTLE